jgi:hypothetical protein
MYAPIVVIVEKYVGKNFRDLTACGVVTLLPHEALDSVGDVVLMVVQDGQEVLLDPYHVLTKAENSLIFDACEIEIVRLLAEGKTRCQLGK